MKLHYDTVDYQAYVKAQKADGLQRRYWKDLPKMWRNELRFRKELEDALRQAIEADVVGEI